MTDRRYPPPGAPRGGPPRGAAPRGAAPRGGAPRQAPRSAPRDTRFGPAPAAPPRGARSGPPRRTAPPPRRGPRRHRRLRLAGLERRGQVGFAAVCVLLVIIGGRLVQLQGLDHGNYAVAAQAQRVYTRTLHALRGPILDRNGTPLAYTSDAQDITADPTQVPAGQRADYAGKLSPLLGVPAAGVLHELAVPGHYAVLATALAPEKALRVENLSLPGIYTQATTQRQYPGHTTAANVIGTVHSDGAGAAGIEAEYNSVLAGHNGSVTYSVDSSGQMNPSSASTTDPARNGASIKLTLDENLQFTAQQLLDTDVAESGAKNATMAVLDSKTGQVLALASSGTFDASDPATMPTSSPVDPPVMSAFEPGSVQKALTFAAALQTGTITPKTTVMVPDAIRMGGVRVADAWVHKTSRFTATGILAESSNVGTLKIAQRLGPAAWMHYEKAFGVGQKTGVGLPAESSGYLPPRSTWSGSTFANLPFGQGLSMTVLQLASFYQTIANNGVRVPPRIVSSVTQADGTRKVTPQPAGHRVITAKTATTLRTMLDSVTLPGGTGVKAAIPGYRVAGKTGTAQQPDPSLGGAYSSSKNWDTFAGMVPSDKPQFVVAIMVDNPAHGVEGGDVAAPLFHHIATYELQHAQIPPTGSHSRHVPLQVCKGQNPAYLPANVC